MKKQYLGGISKLFISLIVLSTHMSEIWNRYYRFTIP